MENTDKENVGVATLGRNRSSGSNAFQKSLIPVAVSSLSPPKDENVKTTTPAANNKIRRPLGEVKNFESPVQKKDTGKPVPKRLEKLKKDSLEPVANHVSVSTASQTGVPLASSRTPDTPQNSPSKLRKSVVGRTGASVTSSNQAKKNLQIEEISYWKQLAESRRKALEDALQENYELHKRIEDLETENDELRKIEVDARKLAELINDISNEDIQLDESGIQIGIPDTEHTSPSLAEGETEV